MAAIFRRNIAAEAEGVAGGGGNLAAEVGDGVVVVAGVDGVGEEDDVGVGGGVHPEAGAGVAGVTEGADGEDEAAGFGEGGVDVPAEAAKVLAGDGGVVGGEAGFGGLVAGSDGGRFGCVGSG